MTTYQNIFNILNKEGIINKELTPWCKFKQQYTEWEETVVRKVIWWNFYAITEQFDCHFPHTSQITEIIGHPPVITDLLRLCNKIEHLDATIWGDWALSIYNTNTDDWVNCDITFDLSHPYIKDQSEATLKQLEELMNNINQK